MNISGALTNNYVTSCPLVTAPLQILRFRVLILLAEEVTGVAGSLAVFFLAEEGTAAFLAVFGVSSTSFGSRVRDVRCPSVSVADCLLTGIQ